MEVEVFGLRGVPNRAKGVEVHIVLENPSQQLYCMGQGPRHLRAIVLKFQRPPAFSMCRYRVVSAFPPPHRYGYLTEASTIGRGLHSWTISRWGLMGGIFVDELCLTFSSTMMSIVMPSHTHGKTKAPTLPILRNGQQLLFTSSQDGACRNYW